MNTTEPARFKSSYSNAEGEACLETGSDAPTLTVTPTSRTAFLKCT